MIASLNLRAALVSFLIAAGFLAAWHVAVRSGASGPALDPEYAKLLGATATTGKSAMPGPLEVGAKIDRKSTRLNSSHIPLSRMPSSA